jgi:hypothetical protein
MKFGNFWYLYKYAKYDRCSAKFQETRAFYCTAIRTPPSNFMKIWQTCCFIFMGSNPLCC